MAVLSKILGLRRDITLGPSVMLIPSASAGSASDYEHIIATVPDLTKLAVSGQAGDLPQNAMQLRLVAWTTEANLTGAATNNFTWQVLQKRAGVLLVSTTTTTAVSSAGAVAITPAAMTNIFVGTALLVDTGASAETVVVTAVTSSTFTATFANTHSSTWNIVSAPLATVTYATTSSSTTISAGTATVTPASMASIYVGSQLNFSGGTGSSETVVVTAVTSTTFTATFANGHSGGYTIAISEVALVPHNIAALAANVLLPNDIITFKRVSSNATGLASPATTVQIDWDAIQHNNAVG